MVLSKVRQASEMTKIQRQPAPELNPLANIIKDKHVSNKEALKCTVGRQPFGEGCSSDCLQMLPSYDDITMPDAEAKLAAWSISRRAQRACRTTLTSRPKMQLKAIRTPVYCGVRQYTSMFFQSSSLAWFQ